MTYYTDVLTPIQIGLGMMFLCFGVAAVIWSLRAKP